jgi:hypothetical protein
MIVYNKTNVDPNQITDKLIKISRKNLIIRSLLGFAAVLVGLITFIIVYLTTKDNTNQIISYLVMGVGVIYIIYNLFMFIKAPKNVLKANEDICTYGAVYNYKFRESYMQIEYLSNGKKGKFQFDYKSIKRFYEYDDYFEIRFKSSDMVIVEKSGFNNEKEIEIFISNVKKGNNKIKIRNKEVKKDV